jgi:hypothetical protein
LPATADKAETSRPPRLSLLGLLHHLISIHKGIGGCLRSIISRLSTESTVL